MAEPIRENEVSGAILDAAIKVHRTLGPGLLDAVYEVALAYELRQVVGPVGPSADASLRFHSVDAR